MSLMAVQGITNQAELARIMQMPRSTINRYYLDLRAEAKEHLVQFTESFAFEFEKALMAINALQHDAYELSKSSKYERNKIMSLALCKDLLVFKTELFTSADVVDKVSSFIEVRKKKIQEMLDNEDEELNKAIMEAEITPPDASAPTTTTDEPSEFVPGESEQEEREIVPQSQ